MYFFWCGPVSVTDIYYTIPVLQLADVDQYYNADVDQYHTYNADVDQYHTYNACGEVMPLNFEYTSPTYNIPLPGTDGSLYNFTNLSFGRIANASPGCPEQPEGYDFTNM